ncbi:hypothetical protein TrLO_g15529 [Triparma laevis f. longispina]|uniref:Uncharacterized protein n=1 Tax=Triparma laevis f. longispina TaxID=1714387 RepID=A0A9W7FFF6_9STRA|nr:hypothetical protein TrLO_g15529 [Triparma laevis f. longispina]
MLFLVDSTSIPAPEIDPSLSTGSFTGTPIKPGSDVILCSLSPASTSVSSSQLAKVAIEGTCQALFLLAPLGLSTTLAIATDLLFLLTLPTRLAYFLCRAISLSTLWLLKSLYKLTTSVKANPLRERTDTYAGGEMELLLVVTSLVILLFLVTTVTTFHAYTFASYSVAEALRFSLESLLTVLLASFDALFNKDFNAIPRYSVSYTLMVPGMYKLHGSKLSKLARFILLCKRQSKSSKSNE